MWLEKTSEDQTQKLRGYITYYESTSEICIDNLGSKYLQDEIQAKIVCEDLHNDETNMLTFFLNGIMEYKLERFKSAEKAFLKSYEYAKKRKDEAFTAKIDSYMAIITYVKRRNPASRTYEKYINRAYRYYVKKDDNTSLSLLFINILWYMRYDPNRYLVRHYLEEASHYVSKSSSDTDVKVYLQIGYIFKNIFGDYTRGIWNLLKAEELSIKYGRPDMEGLAKHIIAGGYVELMHYDEAIRMYRSILYGENYRNVTENIKCIIAVDLIPAYIKVRYFEEAEKMLEELEKQMWNTFEPVKKKLAVSDLWLKAQICMLDAKRQNEIPELLDKCIEYYRADINCSLVSAFDYKVIALYGDYYFIRGDLEQALKYYKHLETISFKYGDWAYRETYSNLARLYTRMGDFKKAYELRKEENLYFEEIKRKSPLKAYDELCKKTIMENQDDYINRLKEKQENLVHQVDVDALTGLPDRTYLKNIRLPHSRSGEMSIFIVDIDDFRTYNENHTHSAGDVCISKVADVVKKVARKKHAEVVRYGGEEFAIVFDYLAEDVIEETAVEILTRVGAADIKRNENEKAKFDIITVSIGIASGVANRQSSFTKLVKKADDAMYEAKNRGKNCFVNF